MQCWLPLLVLAALALPGITHAQTVYFLHTDVQGSVVAVTDANRNVVDRHEYEPYGLPRDPIADGPGYTGHDHDGDSGLVYAQQRYYDPKVGQFLSVDPVGVDPTGGANFNRYWYGNDNPYKFVDPDGMQACQQDEQPCSDTKKAEERRNERRSKAGPGFVQASIVLPQGIRIKDESVIIDNIDESLVDALPIIKSVYEQHGAAEVVITSGNDGRHMIGSDHYEDTAMDLRSNYLSDVAQISLANDLQKNLGTDLTVVSEHYIEKGNNHIHIEKDQPSNPNKASVYRQPGLRREF